MAAKPIKLSTIAFPTKDAATDYFSSMLSRYKDDETIGADDARALYDLLLRHPRADEKIGCGVASFFRAATDYPTSAFHLLRTDGTTTDFSFYSCVKGTSNTLASEFLVACYLCVSDDLREAKAAHFRTEGDSSGRVACAKTGQLIGARDAVYRHTSPEFKEIVAEFIHLKQLTLAPSLLAPSRDMQYGNELATSELRNAFVAFHRSRRKMAIFKKGL